MFWAAISNRLRRTHCARCENRARARLSFTVPQQWLYSPLSAESYPLPSAEGCLTDGPNWAQTLPVPCAPTLHRNSTSLGQHTSTLTIFQQWPSGPPAWHLTTAWNSIPGYKTAFPKSLPSLKAGNTLASDLYFHPNYPNPNQHLTCSWSRNEACWADYLQ